MLWPWFAAQWSPCKFQTFAASFVPCVSTLKVEVEPMAKGYFYISDPFFPCCCHIPDWCFHLLLPREMQGCPLTANWGLCGEGLGLGPVLVHWFFYRTGEIDEVGVVRGNRTSVPEAAGVVLGCHLATKDYIVDVASSPHFTGVAVLGYQLSSCV